MNEAKQICPDDPDVAVTTGMFTRFFNDEQDEHLYFHLRDANHEFMMGLSSILECLKFAEEKGEVPQIPNWWWINMMSYYPKLAEVQRDMDEVFQNKARE